MATSEERREVAARLRESREYISGLPYVSLEQNAFNTFERILECVGYERGNIFDCLSDLIEPTCRNTLPQNWGTFECSECGAQFEVSSVFMTESGNDDSETIIPNYCPECGARVMSEDD